MVFTLALTLTAEQMKFVIWLALTPTLSPEERVDESASLESLEALRVITIALSFAEKAAGQTGASASSKRGERFSFSWGRRPG